MSALVPAHESSASAQRLPILSLRGVSRGFPGTMALVDVDLDIHEGNSWP
ncbi:hypothetical protein LN996_17180 [Arthrobacter sp. AK01]|nr:hypothetical protein [Arthrobacter sp. AK01]MCD4852552.1 hypothetical protein [Arthrobacter sp. AK01]